MTPRRSHHNDHTDRTDTHAFLRGGREIRVYICTTFIPTEKKCLHYPESSGASLCVQRVVASLNASSPKFVLSASKSRLRQRIASSTSRHLVSDTFHNRLVR